MRSDDKRAAAAILRGEVRRLREAAAVGCPAAARTEAERLGWWRGTEALDAQACQLEAVAEALEDEARGEDEEDEARAQWAAHLLDVEVER